MIRDTVIDEHRATVHTYIGKLTHLVSMYTCMYTQEDTS